MLWMLAIARILTVRCLVKKSLWRCHACITKVWLALKSTPEMKAFFNKGHGKFKGWYRGEGGGGSVG